MNKVIPECQSIRFCLLRKKLDVADEDEEEANGEVRKNKRIKMGWQDIFKNRLLVGEKMS